ncbi:hypothetical protein ACRRTK_023937 [Alexandromys fortis]
MNSYEGVICVPQFPTLYCILPFSCSQVFCEVSSNETAKLESAHSKSDDHVRAALYG